MESLRRRSLPIDPVQANVPGVGQVSFAWLAADGSELDTAVAQAYQADVQVGTTVAPAGG